MNKAILIEAEDWEGLFVNGILVEEGHTLNEGESRVKYFNKLAKKYSFDIKELKEIPIDKKDMDDLDDLGSFPTNLKNMKGNYN